jgi:hypothetical protein
MFMANVLKLVERQLEAWNLKRRLQDLGQRPGRCLEGGVAYGPCLVVSREYGSGGSLVARMAGEQLGWHVFDREIVDEIARLAHARQTLTESVDATTRSNWEFPWQSELSPEDIGLEPYLRHLRQVVMTLGHQGDVVILGRGAQYLLPTQCALRVRVVSPLEMRVERVAARAKVAFDKAQACVQRSDSERADFIRKSFRRDAASSLNYDLTVNTGAISVNVAVELVLKALLDKLGVRPPKHSEIERSRRAPVDSKPPVVAK